MKNFFILHGRLKIAFEFLIRFLFLLFLFRLVTPSYICILTLRILFLKINSLFAQIQSHSFDFSENRILFLKIRPNVSKFRVHLKMVVFDTLRILFLKISLILFKFNLTPFNLRKTGYFFSKLIKMARISNPTSIRRFRYPEDTFSQN